MRVLGGGAERLGKRYALVIEAQLKRLARAAVGHGKERDRAVGHELAHAAHELGVRAVDARLAHLEARGDGPCARAQHRREAQALLAAEVELARIRVEPLGRDARGRRRLLDLVGGAQAVVEERAGLGEDHKGVRARVVDGRGGAAVELRQIALERGLGGTGTNELQVSGQGVVVLGAGVERLLGTGHGLVGQGHLAARRDGHALKLADGLAGGRDHAAHAVDLVAEELDTHRRRGLRRKDVHRVTVHVEAAGGVDLAIIGITHAHKKCRDLVEGHLIAHGKRA